MLDVSNQIDLETLSRADLMQMRSAVDKAIPLAEERERRAAFEAAAEAARQHGFELPELMAEGAPKTPRGRKAAPAQAAPVPVDVRFRNPDDASQTWSGRGRRPAWIREALEAGRDIEDLRAA